MIDYKKFYGLSYEDKKKQLLSVFHAINKEYHINNDDFLFLLSANYEIQDTTLNIVYQKLLSLKDKGKDNYFVVSEVKQIMNEFKYDIKNKSENAEDILDTII